MQDTASMVSTFSNNIHSAEGLGQVDIREKGADHDEREREEFDLSASGLHVRQEQFEAV